MPGARIGIIGGTGLYQIEWLSSFQEVKPKTPFGEPSDSIVVGELDGNTLAFLPRHGRGHYLLPSEVPFRANLYALKSLGVEWIIAINSCGSLKETIKPGDLVIPDQLIDRTRGRASTFFGNGLVAHIPFSEPFCPVLSKVLNEAAKSVHPRAHSGGTCIVMEGPAFSTVAESRLYKAWGSDIINMTMLPEAKLAREAEICYASIACVSDYDSWRAKGSYEPVKADMVVAIMHGNISVAKQIIKKAVAKIPGERKCECHEALKTAIITDSHKMGKGARKDLAPIIGKYFK
jgi:5'-methylthioadenosine phosphorylase